MAGPFGITMQPGNPDVIAACVVVGLWYFVMIVRSLFGGD